MTQNNTTIVRAHEAKQIQEARTALCAVVKGLYALRNVPTALQVNQCLELVDFIDTIPTRGEDTLGTYAGYLIFLNQIEAAEFDSETAAIAMEDLVDRYPTGSEEHVALAALRKRLAFAHGIFKDILEQHENQ